MDGESLKRARELKGLTQEDLAALMKVDPVTVYRWEAGIRDPYPSNRQQLHQILGIPMKDLVSERPVNIRKASRDLIVFQALVPDNLTLRLLCIARDSAATSQQVRRRIAHAIEEHLRMQKSEQAAMSRRDALQNLAMFFAVFQGKNTKLPPEETLNLCSAGITASGYLSHGSHEDMKLAFATLEHYLPALNEVTNTSKHQLSAIGLISQALQIKAILAAHLEGQKIAVGYAEQAVSYAKSSGDLVLHVMAARELANQYRHAQRYGPALQTVEEAHIKLEGMDPKEREERMPPYLQSWFYAGLGALSGL